MTQQTFSNMDMPRARRSDPESSKLAAARVAENGTLGRQCECVLAAVRRWPGRTSYELSENIRAVWREQLDRYAVARRTWDLERKGLVRKGAARPCRVNGHQAVTWEPQTGDPQC